MQSPVDADEAAHRRIRHPLKNVVVPFHTVYPTNGQYTRQKDKASTDAAGSSPVKRNSRRVRFRAGPASDNFSKLGLATGAGNLPSFNLAGGNDMAKNRLRNAAVKIGSAVGKVDSTAHKAALKAARAAHVARQELIDLTKQVDALKKQLNKSAKRLKSALK